MNPFESDPELRREAPQSVKLELDTTNFNQLVQPVLDEVNDLRRRVARLEEMLGTNDGS